MSQIPDVKQHPAPPETIEFMRPDGGERVFGAIRRRIVTLVVALGVTVGAVAGYLAYRGPEGLTRGQAADAARWAGQGEVLQRAQEAHEARERGRRADAARWAAQGRAWVEAHGGLSRGRAADGARLAAHGEAQLAGRSAP